MEKDKYQQAIEKHPFALTASEVLKKAEEIISDSFAENNTQEVYKKLYSCIDQTTLSSTDSNESIWHFTEKVNAFDGSHPNIDNVAAICVYPNFVRAVKEALTADVKIASVAGGFPSSQTFTEVKIAETAMAISEGAEEIDIVMNVGLFLDKEYQEMSEEISEIKEACREATLKVILETGALENTTDIYRAAILCLYSGADFLKTSTGKGYPGATPEAVYTMCQAIHSYYEKTGRRVGIKVAGGVSTPEEGVKYYTLVKAILGEEWCHNSLFRIGSSKLSDALLKTIV